MDLLQFHRMRTAVQDNAFPGKETELSTVVGSLLLSAAVTVVLFLLLSR